MYHAPKVYTAARRTHPTIPVNRTDKAWLEVTIYADLQMSFRLRERASAAATTPHGHSLTFLRSEAPLSCMRLLGRYPTDKGSSWHCGIRWAQGACASAGSCGRTGGHPPPR